eukprot:scaffold1440_cov332-Pavlova_lutheri.AAC.26
MLVPLMTCPFSDPIRRGCVPRVHNVPMGTSPSHGSESVPSDARMPPRHVTMTWLRICPGIGMDSASRASRGPGPRRQSKGFRDEEADLPKIRRRVGSASWPLFGWVVCVQEDTWPGRSLEASDRQNPMRARKKRFEAQPEGSHVYGPMRRASIHEGPSLERGTREERSESTPQGRVRKGRRSGSEGIFVPDGTERTSRTVRGRRAFRRFDTYRHRGRATRGRR